MVKFQIAKVNEPVIDQAGQRVGPDYAFRNIVITDSGMVSDYGMVNAKILKEALLNTPSFLKNFGLKIVPIEEPAPSTDKKAE